MLRRKKQHALSNSTPINNTHPIRLAFLGGLKTGKTTLATALTTQQIPDTYYPTIRVTPYLFTYAPTHLATQILLGKLHPTTAKYLPPPTSPPAPKNPYYKIINDATITPIEVEIIDTPAFNPTSTVPFLEQSIHIDLGPEYLHNLANFFPRKPVLTKPLLVASGASELNGDIDAYIIFYDAVPTLAPPQYGENMQDLRLDERHSFELLTSIKDALEDAWRSYLEYQETRRRDTEKDMYDIKAALKIWKDKSEVKDIETKSLPPVWIVCSKSDHSLASEKLVDMGRELSIEWGCGFVVLDLQEADTVLALIIKDIVNRRRK